MPLALGDRCSSARWRADLGADLACMSRERRARELELPARLERDRGMVALERDERAPVDLADRLPSEAALEKRRENPHDAPFSLVGNRPSVRRVDAELLGFGPDAPPICGFHGLVKRNEEIVVRKGQLGPRFYVTKALRPAIRTVLSRG